MLSYSMFSVPTDETYAFRLDASEWTIEDAERPLKRAGGAVHQQAGTLGRHGGRSTTFAKALRHTLPLPRTPLGHEQGKERG